MRIGLFNLEPKVENTAMMQVSRYYKNQGVQVEKYSPLFYSEYDKIYAFSLFDFTSKKNVTKDMIVGGTGFDLTTKLPPEIENCDLDYSLYPNCKTSYLWFSRGCIHHCPFCCVPKKEGMIHSVEPHNLNQKGKTITIVDNNPFVNPKWEEMLEFLIEEDKPVNFCSGVSLRDFNDLHGLALQKLRFHKQLNVAWDNPREDLRPKIEQLIRYIKPYKIQCYVLVGYWSTEEEDLYRIMWLKSKGIDPYVMPYNKKSHYQLNLARWVNRRIIAKCNWQDYDQKIRGNFYC